MVPNETNLISRFHSQHGKNELHRSEEEVEKINKPLEKMLNKGKASAKDISKITGRLVSMQPAVGKLVYLITRHL